MQVQDVMTRPQEALASFIAGLDLCDVEDFAEFVHQVAADSLAEGRKFRSEKAFRKFCDWLDLTLLATEAEIATRDPVRWMLMR